MPGILERWRMLFRPQVYKFSFGPDAPAEVLNMTARALYNSQDNLAAVVNFLANSIAQLPLKVYRRGSGDARERDRESAAALLLWKPNGDQTEYEFIRALATEYFVFGCVYIWILPDSESESGYQARIIPTDWITTTERINDYGPDRISVVSPGGGHVEIPRSEFVRFNTYSPGNPGGYVSPISALQQTLEEQIQAGRFRKDLWKSSGRLNAQIVRPKDVQPWTEPVRERWIKAFREAWGAGGNNAGSIPLMEDGMEIKTFNASFKEQQWVESVKLSRESVAAAYRINPSLVWHSDTQTYASSKDNARALYAECLGPDLQMFQQRINSFLLPMLRADPGTYVEFDLTEKLKGSFEERASIIQASVGAPWLTRNEARRDNNLPPVEGGDDLIIPLNVMTGGQASPQDVQKSAEQQVSVLDLLTKRAKTNDEIAIENGPTEEEQKEIGNLLKRFFERQGKSILPKLQSGSDWWNSERWNKELADDLEPVLHQIAEKHGTEMSKALESVFLKDLITNYLRKMAEKRAELINDETYRKLMEAIDGAEDESPSEAAGHEIETRSGFDALLLGAMLAKTTAGWGTKEACRQARDQGSKKQVFKVWVTGPSARQSHSAMNGERVPIDDRFSNGADWPGDDSLSPEESCGCNCSTKIIVEG